MISSGLVLSGIFTLCLTTTTTSQPPSGLFDILLQNKSILDVGTNSSKLTREAPITSISSPENIQGGGGSEFGEECETNGRDCNYAKYLECIDGRCLCQNPHHRAYDEDLGQCVNLAGSGCGGNGPPCVKNAQCSYGTCQCLQNHSETMTKVCLLNTKMPCKPNECNGDQGLACIRGTCQCIDSLMIFQPFTGKCISPQVEFERIARTVVERVVNGKISMTVNGAKSLAQTIVLFPVRLLVPGIG